LPALHDSYGSIGHTRNTPNINGTVLEDGTFGATIGFQRLTGKFSRDKFEGTFKSSYCEWTMLLRHTK
jgi:hypothetical protein